MSKRSSKFEDEFAYLPPKNFISRKSIELDNDKFTDSLRDIDKFDGETKSSKRKRIRKKTLKSKLIVLKKKIETVIIDESKNKTERKKTKAKLKPLIIDFIYRRNQYSLNIIYKTTIKELREKISEIIEVPIDDFDLYLKEDLIEKEKDEEIVNEIIKNVKFPFFDVRKKTKEFKLLSELYKINYVNKVIINGINDVNDLNNYLDNFFKDILIHKDFLLETLENNKYSIGFKTPDLAFDFHRYILTMKLFDSNLENIKSHLKLENNHKSNKKRKVRKRNLNNNDLYDSSPFINFTSPYISYADIRKKDEIEGKKKWICDKNFISTVGKNNKRIYSKYT